jgi:hydroxymethylglutaryl-CoA lyase
VSTAFGCTIQGEVKQSEVLRLMQALLDAGCDRVSLADTVGYADPAAVQRLFEGPRARWRATAVGGHFHDTRGWAWPTSTPPADRRAPLRRLPGRHRRLPARAGRQRQRQPPKTWPTCCAAWASTPAWTSTRCWRCAQQVAGWLAGRGAAWHAVARRLAQDTAHQ